jgi:hypothetical protein
MLANAMPGTQADLIRRTNKAQPSIARALRNAKNEGLFKCEDGVYSWVAPLPPLDKELVKPTELPAWVTKVIENWDLVDTELTTKEDITQWLSENAKTIILGCKYMDLSYKLKQAEES